MPTFNTNNPVPSADGRDLSDNAQTIDEVVNSSNSSAMTRTGKSVATLSELESKYVQTAINGGIWASGQSFTAFNQYMVFANTAYKPKSSAELPYVVGATPVGDSNVEPVDTGVAAVESAVKSEIDRLNPDTLAIAIADEGVKLDEVLTTKEELIGEGGGARWDVVASNAAPPIGDGVVQSIGVPGLTLVRRDDDRINNKVDAEAVRVDSNADTETVRVDLEIARIDSNDSVQDGRLSQSESNISALSSGQGAGVFGFATKALMDADLTADNKAIAYVTNDVTPTNNGTYRKSGGTGVGSWIQSSSDLASQAFQIATDLEQYKNGILYMGGNNYLTIVTDVPGGTGTIFFLGGHVLVGALTISVGTTNTTFPMDSTGNEVHMIFVDITTQKVVIYPKDEKSVVDANPSNYILVGYWHGETAENFGKVVYPGWLKLDGKRYKYSTEVNTTRQLALMSYAGQDGVNFKSGIKVDTNAGKITVIGPNGNWALLDEDTRAQYTITTGTTSIIEKVSGDTSTPRLTYLILNLTDDKIYGVTYDAIGDVTDDYLIVGNYSNEGLGKAKANVKGSIEIDGCNYGSGQLHTGQLQSSIDGELYDNLVDTHDANALLNSYYSPSNGVSVVNDDRFDCTGLVPITAGKTYTVPSVENGGANAFRNFYGADTLWLFADTSPIVAATFVCPVDVFFVSQVIPKTADQRLSTYMIVEGDTLPSSYVPHGSHREKLIKSESIGLFKPDALERVVPPTFGLSKIGALPYQDFDADYSQVIVYGQSLAVGYQAERSLTTASITDTFMVGNQPWISNELGGYDGSITINPLTSTATTNSLEPCGVAAVNAFKRMFDRNHRLGTKRKFLLMHAGHGGYSIEQLSKGVPNNINTEGSYTTNAYEDTFIYGLDKTKAAVDALGKTVACTAIIFMQGESNYELNAEKGWELGSEATHEKTPYKNYLIQLKADMEADIALKYSQGAPPIFFIYQTAGKYLNRRDMSINMAQAEFAAENDNVILLNSTYCTTEFAGGHLDANGYRWYGEIIAKAMSGAFLDGHSNESTEAVSVKYKLNQVTIDCRVPTPPLVFDTYTTAAIQNQGFNVFKDSVGVLITDVSIVGGTRIILTCAEELTGTIEITYAGMDTLSIEGSSSGTYLGSGNVRDSSEWRSRYLYVTETAGDPSYLPRDKDGALLGGKPYPCQNWLGHFYRVFN